MLWNRIKDNFKESINGFKDQWIWFIDDQIDVVEGKRNHFRGKTKKLYVIDIDEAEKRLADWQDVQRQKLLN